MFDIGMTELLVIGIVALIVVGPKDLPGMFRTLGRFTAKMKGMARDFQRAMDAAADETGVKDVAKDLRAATDPKKMGLDRLNQAADTFEKWDPAKAAKAARRPAGPETAKLGADRAAAGTQARDEAMARAAERRAATAPMPDPAAPAPPPTAARTDAAGITAGIRAPEGAMARGAGVRSSAGPASAGPLRDADDASTQPPFRETGT